MSYQDDKRELLKLKQGIIEESETIKEEEKPAYELHGMKRVSNFFYHYKWHVIVSVFFAVVLGFFIYTIVVKERADIRVIVAAKDGATASNLLYKTADIEHALENYCPDIDNSGYVHAEVYNIDLSDNIRADYMLASVTKLTGEVNYGGAAMFIIDTPTLESLTSDDNDGFFLDLEERYPDCPFVSGIRYNIKGSDLAVFMNYVEACPDDFFIAIRAVEENSANRGRLEEANKGALELMDNIVAGDYAGWVIEEGRIYGVDGE